MKRSKEENSRLIAAYPFLLPRNVFTDAPAATAEDCEFTLLDEVPEGWREAFGEQLCAELKTELEKAGRLESYRIRQIKEKFGELRWYDFGGTAETDAIIEKYRKISRFTCICCGKPAEYLTAGWIEPYCGGCIKLLPQYPEKVTRLTLPQDRDS